ncbi:MAG: TraX family protein [Lachnospiraceae bacterium]
MLRNGLNGNQLKLIAVVAMLIDHIGVMIGQLAFKWIRIGSAQYQFWNTIYLLHRSFGRIAFPIFCFLIAEGFFHTRNWKKYAARLGLFALISELPFDYMLSSTWIYWEYQNVFWTLLLGVLMLAAIRSIAQRFPGQTGLFLQLLTIGAFCGAAHLIKSDYSYFGIILIAIFYWFRSERSRQCLLGYIWMLWTVQVWQFKIALLIPFILLYLYNGERGREWRGSRWFFYLFYPVHMIAAAFICPLFFR